MPRGPSLGLLLLALVATGCSTKAVAVLPPHPTGLAIAGCDALSDRLPAQLNGLPSRTTEPQSQLTHAWGSPAVTLSCGVTAPKGYRPLSTSTLDVDDVDWFEQVGKETVVWTAILPRPVSPEQVYVAVTVPKHYSAAAAFLTGLAGPLKSALR